MNTTAGLPIFKRAIISFLEEFAAYPFYRISLVQQTFDQTLGNQLRDTSSLIYENGNQKLMTFWNGSEFFVLRQYLQDVARWLSARFNNSYSSGIKSLLVQTGAQTVSALATNPAAVLLARSASDVTMNYAGVFSSIQQVYRACRDNGTLTELYSGIGGSLLQATLQNGASFAVEKLLPLPGAESSLRQYILKLLVTRWFVPLMLYPLHTVQNRQMASQDKGFVACCREIYDRHGVTGFFRGIVAFNWHLLVKTTVREVLSFSLAQQ